MLLCSTSLVIHEGSGAAWPALSIHLPRCLPGKVFVLVSPQRNACPGHHKMHKCFMPSETPLARQGGEPGCPAPAVPLRGVNPSPCHLPPPSLLSPDWDQPGCGAQSWVLCAADGQRGQPNVGPACPACPSPEQAEPVRRQNQSTESLKLEKPSKKSSIPTFVQIPPCPLNHPSKCCLQLFFEHFQGWRLQHCPGDVTVQC